MIWQKKQFKPFEHEDLDIKNNLINYARSISNKNEPDARLACAVIYASFAEYLAGHLLDTLRHLMYTTTYKDFAAILYVDQRKDSKIRTLGQTVSLLRGYMFPDKKEIIELLEQINKSRNNLFHNFASLDEKKSKQFDENMDTISANTEELFNKINVIYDGLSKILLPQENASRVPEQKE